MESKDYYLEHPPQQPKRELGEYAEENNLPVPRRFPTFEEADAACGDFVARFEHPQDYNGASNLGLSIFVEPIIKKRSLDPDYIGRSQTDEDIKAAIKAKLEACTEEEFQRKLLKLSEERLKDYAFISDQDEEEFLSQASYSYWEYVPGMNGFMIADSSIEDRLHIRVRKSIFESCYLRMQGTELEGVTGTFSLAQPERMRQFREFYDRIRNLDRFDPNHCPLIEFQMGEDGKLWFLQSHRTRDFNASTFELTREAEEGEIEALLARGATPSEEGLQVQAGFTLDWEAQEEALPTPKHETCSITGDYYEPFEEFMTRRRGIQVLRARSIRSFGKGLDGGHMINSHFFKPEISVVCHTDTLWSTLLQARPDLTPYNTIPLHIISDGRRALLRVLED